MQQSYNFPTHPLYMYTYSYNCNRIMHVSFDHCNYISCKPIVERHRTVGWVIVDASLTTVGETFLYRRHPMIFYNKSPPYTFNACIIISWVRNMMRNDGDKVPYKLGKIFLVFEGCLINKPWINFYLLCQMFPIFVI